MRTESDTLGTINIPDDCYAGINYRRAKENFELRSPLLQRSVYHELFLLKKSAAAVNGELGFLPKKKAEAITAACNEALAGRFDNWLDLPAHQGGAGTSVNMTVNEIIANRAEEVLGGNIGEYRFIHPNNDVNMFQSTNDTFPTAVKIAVIRALRKLADTIAGLQSGLQKKEQEFAAVLKTGRTEMQDAVPVTLGQEFGSWAEAVARDRWRVYKAEERLKQINLGGTAAGTGITAPKQFIFQWHNLICRESGIPLARAENTVEATQNCDQFVEVSGLLKCCAVNLQKISGDLRLLSSGPHAGLAEIELPSLQAGSSLMPGKTNPVMAEMITSISMQVCGNDNVITGAAAAGQLELNPFTPLIAWNLLNSIEMLDDGCSLLQKRCIPEIKANTRRCRKLLERSSAFALLLTPYLGYSATAELVKRAEMAGKQLLEIAVEEGLFTREELDAITDPAAATSPGIPGSSLLRERIERNGLYNNKISNRTFKDKS